MRNIVLALVIAGMATPAYAQFSPNLAGGGASRPKTDVEIKQEQEREAGYKNGVSRIPDAKGKSDPWSGVRSAAPAPGQSQSRSHPK